ncbi:MAG: ATP-binding cassette domain-containing protein, partial [Candidatus Marinimicrobia bacterium]|nr:ATP-binding cassette domain-containing protein [Candidatus Neomarinimicrobiota bacterium]
PKESRNLGVSMVFQEVLVADEASIVDNLFIGIDGFFSKTMSDKEKQDKARTLLSELADEDIDPLMPAANLPLSTKAWITIARGLLSEPDLLILDESSAALDFDSTERLFNKMRELRNKGTAIIIVTHRIAELVRISDRCTVMRDGKDVGVLEKSEITEKNLLQLMTGKDQSKDSVKQEAHKTSHSQAALRINKMRVWPTSEESNFELLKGEIVGITGLDGHGQDDFVRILAGISTADSGVPQVSINHGDDFSSINTLEDAKKHGIAFVSGDRKKEGILPNLSIVENLAISMYDKNTNIPGVRLIEWGAINDIYDWEVERLAIKAGAKENLITSLSGGNQQKVMLGRVFATHPKTLVLLDPARGIDLQTKRDLYKQLREFADEGNSVIYMSSELEEFIGFCSRVIVFRNGSIFETFLDQQINADGILESMFGHIQNENLNNNQNFIVDEEESKIDKHLVDSKHTENKKLENDVSKYNVSKYFKNEIKAVDSVKPKNQDFSSADEEHFNSIINSSESKKNNGKKFEKKTVDELADSFEYSQDDSNQFDKLMEFNKSSNSRFNSSKIKKTDTYSDSDEKLFNKSISQSEENETKRESINADGSHKKKANPNNLDSKSNKSNTQEYSKDDIQKFEKLNTKE